MSAAMAPAFCAFSTFSVNSQTPRLISAILPLIEPAGNGSAPPVRVQPSRLPVVAALPPATYGAGPTVSGGAVPNSAGPMSRPVSLAGTGAGPVTSMTPGEIVTFFDTAPAPITFGEFAGALLVASSG